jgi:7-cyano-7-deazaguanine synthase in queuosine biosynthesis
MATFYFYRGQAPAKPLGTALELGADVITGAKSLEDLFGAGTSLEVDLLNIAAAVFAVDRCQLRGEREDYSRVLELHIPIINIGHLQPFIPEIQNVLRELSNDWWSLNFYQVAGKTCDFRAAVPGAGKVLLFSGGLDSLAAAVELSNDSENLALVSHVTKNRQTSAAQTTLFEKLVKSGRNLSRYSYFVSSRDKGEVQHDIESSQRTRSFLFLVLAAITAVRLDRREIVMIAENGQMAIHLPLSSARVGAFSTHTAHPDVVAKMRVFLSAAFKQDFKIENPYVLKTKREVIKPIIDKFPEIIADSTSCWKSARILGTASHCGECIPCYIRRIAIESYQKDPTAYARDVFSLSFRALAPEDEGRRNLAELAEFTLNFEAKTDQDICDEWPELYSSNIDAPAVITDPALND